MITNKLITNTYFDSSFVFNVLREYENEDTYADLVSFKTDNPEIYATKELNLKTDNCKFYDNFLQIDNYSIDPITLRKNWKILFNLYETNHKYNIGICKNVSKIFKFKYGIIRNRPQEWCDQMDK